MHIYRPLHRTQVGLRRQHSKKGKCGIPSHRFNVHTSFWLKMQNSFNRSENENTSFLGYVFSPS